MASTVDQSNSFPAREGELDAKSGRNPFSSGCSVHRQFRARQATSSNRTRTSPRLIAVELRYNKLAKLDRTGWKVTIVDPPYA
jgi:hypothetical protein